MTFKLSEDGQTRLSLQGWDVSAQLLALRPGGLPELVLSVYSGGAHCCTTYLMYTQDSGSLQNIGVLDGSNYGVSFVDLNHDGTRELIVGGDSLAYYDWSYAASPSLNTVLGWDGLQLADRTRFYAYVPGQEAARNWERLQAQLKLGSAGDWDSTKASLGGYFGNMILAGRGLEAQDKLMAVWAQSPRLKGWFEAHRADLISATYAQPESRLHLDDSPTPKIGQPDGQ